MKRHKPEPPHRGERFFVQIPLSEAERIAMRYKAVDAHVSLGDFLREALGLPPRTASAAPPLERRAAM